MPLYEADGTKQKPIARTGTAFYSHANCPPAQTIVKRPSYVIVNNAGNFSFAYESGSYPSTYITGSVRGGTPGGPVKLEINPCAWRRTDSAGSEGDVTFVYVRVS